MADGDWDWLDAISNLGFDAGDLGSLVLDTETGQLVDISSLSAQDHADLDAEGLTGGGSGQLNLGPSSTSTSDHLRSLQADPTTPGSEPFDYNAMADPSASIASAGGNADWAKAMAQGLSNALGGLKGGLSGLAGDSPTGGGGAGGGLPAMVGGGAPGVGGMESSGGLPGLQGLLRPGAQDPIGAAYTAVTANPSAKYGMQAAIDPGPAPRPFTPLAIPTTGGGVPMAGQSAAPRMSGLQRLLLERLG